MAFPVEVGNMDKVIFENFGIVVIERNGKFYVQYDSGESASRMIEKEITEAEAEKAMKSERDAYEMLLAREKRQ